MRSHSLKTLAATALCGLALAQPARAGTDTLVHFTNLSPFTATIEFPRDGRDCWYDHVEDDRIKEYYDYYRTDSVAGDANAEYLKAFKLFHGIEDFRQIPNYNMNHAPVALAPAVHGQKVGTGIFLGETSASLFDGCKNTLSSRTFTVKLSDDRGGELSKRLYRLEDPDSDQWRLRRMTQHDRRLADTTLTLGSGGHGDAVEIGVATAIGVLTVVSLGSATAELLAARALVASAYRVALMEAAIMSAGRAVPIATRPFWRYMFTYAWNWGMRAGATGGGELFRRGVASGIIARLGYTTVVNGVIYTGYHLLNQDGSKTPQSSGPLEIATSEIDFSKPVLEANPNLPPADERSICLYKTRTLGMVSECRAVGISLSILPDGSISFLPLPSVGYGED